MHAFSFMPIIESHKYFHVNERKKERKKDKRKNNLILKIFNPKKLSDPAKKINNIILTYKASTSKDI
jgi:hypothetical protein